MGIIRCEHMCRYQVDGYCRLRGHAAFNPKGVAQTGCAFFERKKKG